MEKVMGNGKKVPAGKSILGKIVLGMAVVGLGFGWKSMVSQASTGNQSIGITTESGKNMSFTTVKDTKEDAVFSLNRDGSAHLKSGSIGMGADSTIEVGNIKVKKKGKQKKSKKKAETVSIQLVTGIYNKGTAVIKTEKKNSAQVTLEEGDTIIANGGVSTTAGKGGAVLHVSYSVKQKKAVFELIHGTTSNTGGLVVTLMPGGTKTKLPIGVKGTGTVMVSTRKDGTYQVEMDSSDVAISLAEETYEGKEGTVVYIIDTDSNVYVDSIVLQPGETTDQIRTGGKRMTVSNRGDVGKLQVKSGNLAAIVADSGAKIEVGIGKKSRSYTVPEAEQGMIQYKIQKDNKLERVQEKVLSPSITPLPTEQPQFFYMGSTNPYLAMYSANTEVGKIVEINE